MMRDLKRLIAEHIEKGVLGVCFLIFLIVLILQMTGGREGFGKAVNEHIKKIEGIRSGVKVDERDVPDYTSEMEKYWTIEDRPLAQAYTTIPFVAHSGPIVESQPEIMALEPEKVTAVAELGRNVVVVSLSPQQADLVRRVRFEGKVLFKLYRNKKGDEDYILTHDQPYEALALYEKRREIAESLAYKLQGNKPLNPGELDLAVALGLMTPQDAEEIKKPKVEAPKPEVPKPAVSPWRRRRTPREEEEEEDEEELDWDADEEASRREDEEKEQKDTLRRILEMGEEGEYVPEAIKQALLRKLEGEAPTALTPQVPGVVSAIQVDLPTALGSPLPLEDTKVEADVSYQYKVEVILETPEEPMSAISLPSNLVQALSDIKMFLRGGTEFLANIEVRKWVAGVSLWAPKSFSVKRGEAIGSPLVITLRDKKGELLTDAEGKFLRQEVNFSTGCTLVDLEKRVKFDPEKALAKRPTLRMAYLNSKGGLEYKWTERMKLAAIVGGAAPVERRTGAGRRLPSRISRRGGTKRRLTEEEADALVDVDKDWAAQRALQEADEDEWERRRGRR